MSDTPRTTPHGWPVRVSHEETTAGDDDVFVLLSRRADTAPRPEVVIPAGRDWRSFDDPSEVRGLAMLLLQAADILEATQRGEYVPPR